MTVDRAAIIEQLKLIFQRIKNEDFDLSKVTEQASFRSDLNLDSLGLLEMRFDVERIWGVTLSDKDAAQLQFVGEVIDLIAAQGLAPAGAVKSA